MLGKGSGFHIPVYRLIREYKSYRDCRAGENLEWEEENVLWLNRRYAPAKAVGAALLMLLLTGVSFSAEYKNENIEIASYGDLMALTALSFICAQDSYNLTAARHLCFTGESKKAPTHFRTLHFQKRESPWRLPSNAVATSSARLSTAAARCWCRYTGKSLIFRWSTGCIKVGIKLL